MNPANISGGDVDRAYEALRKDAIDGGYRLSMDTVFVKDLVRGLLKNTERYGYPACPCRLASGKKEEDLDIICPCDYRDADIEEYGACYCALYVNEAIAGGSRTVSPVPERRPPRSERGKIRDDPARPVAASPSPFAALPLPVWRCRVCGYLCAREQPPGICPVCKAKKDRFERFI